MLVHVDNIIIAIEYGLTLESLMAHTHLIISVALQQVQYSIT